MNYCLVNFGPVQTDGRTESDAYESTVQSAQVGSESIPYTTDEGCPALLTMKESHLNVSFSLESV